jgi:hypothetical protein
MNKLDKISVGASWTSFEDAILPKGAPEIQRIEMRRAFYGGAFSILATCLTVVGDPAVPDEEGVKLLDRLHKECMAFARRVGAGKGA